MINDNYTLIDELQELWGAQFQELNNSQRLWLLSCVTGTMTADVSEDYEPMDVGDLTSATERFDELSFYEQVALAEALIHQIKYHRYNR